MVRDPHGQGSPGPVIVQGYSWLVSALLQWLAAGLAYHMAAVIWFRTPGVYFVQWNSSLVRALLPRVSIWLGTQGPIWSAPPPPWACHCPGLFLVSMCVVT